MIIPNVSFLIKQRGALVEIPANSIFRNCIVVGLPCCFESMSESIIHSYMNSLLDFKSLGFYELFFTTVNDQNVTEAWVEHLSRNGLPGVRIISDANHVWSDALNVTEDMSKLSWGIRNLPYVALIRNSEIESLWVDTLEGRNFKILKCDIRTIRSYFGLKNA